MIGQLAQSRACGARLLLISRAAFCIGWISLVGKALGCG